MSDHSPAFDRYIGIDYSGAQTPDQSLKGLRAYTADRSSSPVEVPPPPSPRKYWTRKGLAQWLVEIFREDVPTIVGIDHSFSFPIRYFETHHILPDWQTFLDDLLNLGCQPENTAHPTISLLSQPPVPIPGPLLAPESRESAQIGREAAWQVISGCSQRR